MATQFDYFGFKYEILEDKKNEVALIDATSGQGHVTVPKQVEYEGKTYTVTVIGYRLVKNYKNVETDKRKTVKWEECEAIKIGAFGRYRTKGLIKVSDLYGAKEKVSEDWNESVTSVKLPDSIKIIDDSAFRMCSNLEEVNIPDGVTSIGKSAFWACENLKQLVIPDSVMSIEEAAFMYVKRLETINIPHSITVIKNCSFDSCKKLKKIVIPDTVTTIEAGAFRDSGLEEITIPSSVKTIGAVAFYNYHYIDNKEVSVLKTVNIMNDEGNVVIHPKAFCPEGVTINYLGYKAPKRQKEDTTSKPAAPAKEKADAPAKGATIDLEKLIQAALADGVVTDKERSILIKKVKEAGGDVDEFELLLDARIYEATQKHAKTEPKASPVKEKKETPKEAPKAEKKPTEVKKETPAAATKATTDEGRKVWENMEKDVKPALQIMDNIVAALPFVKDGSYQVNYASKNYIGFAQNGKAKNFAVFFPQGKALSASAGMDKSPEIDKIGKVLPSFEHKVDSRNNGSYTFKFPVDKAVTAEQIKAAVSILDMARKNFEK